MTGCTGWRRQFLKAGDIRAESGDLQPLSATAERADRPVERYRTRIDPPDLIAGGATAREEYQ
jgi:hypothetical protein